MMRRVLAIVAIAAAGGLGLRAQMRVVPLDEARGHVALGLLLRRLANTGVAMQATAHPDDEDNGLLVMLNRGQGVRTALATATRGNGGQNEIGPEIFEALGVLRTEELAALHRFDGAEQYFTRAVDFGFSFSIEETFEKWGRQEITADFVRLIRMVRPDVVFTAFPPTGTGGGQHHEASAVLAHDAYLAAGDPSKFPEQIREGLRPWQPRKFYYSAGFPGTDQGGGRVLRINTAIYDPLLGKTYAEIGTEARSMHKCQGMAQLLALPGPVVRNYRLAETTLPGGLERDESSMFDGIDTSLAGLARFAGASPPAALVDGLAAVAAAVADARRQFDGANDAATAAPLMAGLHAVRALRAALGRLPLDPQARADIDFRLQQKESEFQQAILVADAVHLEALADDGVVVPGQTVKVSAIVANNGGGDVTVKQVAFGGFEGGAACGLTAITAANPFGGGRGAAAGGRGGRGGGRGGSAPPPPVISTVSRQTAARCDVSLRIPAGARMTEPYWHRQGEAGRYTFDADAPFGLPFRPTPFTARFTLAVPGGSEEIVAELPVQYRYEGNIFSGEKRTELLVVPALSVRVSPEIAIIPARAVGAGAEAARGRGAQSRPTGGREIRVTVVNDAPGAAEAVVRLQLPPGWTAAPAEQALAFSREDESQTVRFVVAPPSRTAPGEYHVRASASTPAQTFDRGYQVIEYPHIRRRHIYHEADVALKILDVRTAPNLTIGYIVGVGDEVPQAIEQLGARLEYITPDELAWGDLARFDAIVTGVRAYERRADLRANNRRLLEYVRAGGTLIVQYNKFEFNEAQYGPYPAQVSGNRVTDESSPVMILAPDDPVMTFPNEITDATWKNWVQERGLYFLGERDSRYRDLIALEDPFPYNKGTKTGALVEATYGKGRWVYVGLGLWRQLPAGTDGAYQLLANLISLGKAPASGPERPRAPAARGRAGRSRN